MEFVGWLARVVVEEEGVDEVVSSGGSEGRVARGEGGRPVCPRGCVDGCILDLGLCVEVAMCMWKSR